jgi:hypothetical protein
MLNPSTADALEDDPTIRRCIGFAKREGCGSLRVLNLFAYRSTDPNELLHVDDPVGPYNDAMLKGQIPWGAPLVLAWGAVRFRDRIKQVLSFVRESYAPFRCRRTLCPGPHCLGLTKQGQPRHPLYLPNKAALIPFNLDDFRHR